MRKSLGHQKRIDGVFRVRRAGRASIKSGGATASPIRYALLGLRAQRIDFTPSFRIFFLKGSAMAVVARPRLEVNYAYRQAMQRLTQTSNVRAMWDTVENLMNVALENSSFRYKVKRSAASVQPVGAV
jgi:hypothetical protein